MFNPDYLPDRLDLIKDRDSIGMQEFLYVEKLKHQESFINRALNKIFKIGG